MIKVVTHPSPKRGKVVEIGPREDQLLPGGYSALPVPEQAQQLVEAVGRDLEEVRLGSAGAGHDRAAAVEWRLHQLQVGVVGRGDESQPGLAEARVPTRRG